MNEPSLTRALACILIAATCIVAAIYSRQLPEWSRTLLVLCGGAFLLLAMLTIWDWIAPRLADAEERKARARANTEAVVLAQLVSGMTEYQAQAFIAVYPTFNTDTEPIPDLAPDPVRVILTSEDHQHSQYLDLPLSTQQITVVAALLASGRPFALASFAGQGKPLSRAEFESLRDYFFEHGLARWRNDRAPNQGIELTPPGRALMRRFSSPPSPPGEAALA